MCMIMAMTSGIIEIWWEGLHDWGWLFKAADGSSRVENKGRGPRNYSSKCMLKQWSSSVGHLTGTLRACVSWLGVGQ